jgi:hypothetical protein
VFWVYVGVSLTIAWLLSRPLVGSLEDIRIHTSPRKHFFLFLMIAVLGIIADRVTILHYNSRPNFIIPLSFVGILSVLGVQMVIRSLRFRNNPIDN